jgi:hypothetical protein
MPGLDRSLARGSGLSTVARCTWVASVALVTGLAACTGTIGELAPGAPADGGGRPSGNAGSGGGVSNVNTAGRGGAVGSGVDGGSGVDAGNGSGAGGHAGAPGSGGAAGSGGAGASGGAGGSGGAPAAPGGIWQPPPVFSWQWQLTGTLDQTVQAQMFDVDLFDTPAATVTALHALGHKVICYVSAGSFEDWRPDAAQFPAAVKGNALDGWPGEQWLDVRQWSALEPVLGARMDLCRSKGFDGIELDNVDGYSNDTGFPLTGNDQLTFNRALAAAAHARGLSVGLKNDLDQVASLVGNFDWALNEECFEYAECDLLRPFVAAGKAVFNVEYTLTPDQFCPDAQAMGFNSLSKHLNLDAYRVACP